MLGSSRFGFVPARFCAAGTGPGRTDRGGAHGALGGSAACDLWRSGRRRCRRPRCYRRAGTRRGRRNRTGDDPRRRELGPEIRGLYLVIDDNPSPLAAHFVLGPIADAREIATRVRIDDYTYLHAVAETADGRLYATAQFIKAAGGCSAPAGKDQALALERLGKMKLNLADRSRPDAPIKSSC